MGERDDAKHQIEQARQRMTAAAREVSRRMTADYAKDRVKDMAREEALDIRERALDHPWFAPLLGAGIGWLAGRALVSRAQERRMGGWGGLDRRYTARHRRFSDEWLQDRHAYASPIDEPSAAERVGEAASELRGQVEGKASEMKEKAMETRDRLSEKAGEYRERIARSAGAIGDRIPDREAIRSSTREQPGLWALGAMAAGALFGFALPVSETERQVLEPAREKLHDVGSQAIDEAASRMETRGERAADAQSQSHQGASLSPGANAPPSTNEPLH